MRPAPKLHPVTRAELRKRLEEINQVINWSKVEEILMARYTVGIGREGADAYSPPPLWPEAGLGQVWSRVRLSW